MFMGSFSLSSTVDGSTVSLVSGRKAARAPATPAIQPNTRIGSH